MNAQPPILPAHLEETIGSITRLHAEHHQNATPLQRAVDRVTALVGRPRFLGVLSWISLNLLAGALYVVGLILATQRRESLTTSASSSTWSWRC